MKEFYPQVSYLYMLQIHGLDGWHSCLDNMNRWKNNSYNYYYQIVAQEICDMTNTKFHIYFLTLYLDNLVPNINEYLLLTIRNSSFKLGGNDIIYVFNIWNLLIFFVQTFISIHCDEKTWMRWILSSIPKIVEFFRELSMLSFNFWKPWCVLIFFGVPAGVNEDDT
jgi:hypothetical protein